MPWQQPCPQLQLPAGLQLAWGQPGRDASARPGYRPPHFPAPRSCNQLSVPCPLAGFPFHFAALCPTPAGVFEPLVTGKPDFRPRVRQLMGAMGLDLLQRVQEDRAEEGRCASGRVGVGVGGGLGGVGGGKFAEESRGAGGGRPGGMGVQLWAERRAEALGAGPGPLAVPAARPSAQVSPPPPHPATPAPHPHPAPAGGRAP